ncbi:MAG TPA: hypothetical protein VF615_21320 [Longimicrobiaceae bacterium]|jgi:hypothetical protein
MPTVNGRLVLGRSDSRCQFEGYNYAPGLGRAANRLSRWIWGAWHTGLAGGVDQDVQQFFAGRADPGICAGITMAWVINVLNDGSGAALGTGTFSGAFTEQLRFQGAYFQKLGHNITPFSAERFFNHIDGAMTTGIAIEEEISANSLYPMLPGIPTWAASANLGPHAIGAARVGGSYYIMDPNFGLYVYTDAQRFCSDMEDIYFAYDSLGQRRRARMELTVFRRA